MSFLSRCFRHIMYCYANALRFDGRDERQIFCDFYLFLCIMLLVVGGGFWLILYKHPAVVREHVPHSLVTIYIVCSFNILTLGSAATRRGHDLNMSFWQVWFRRKTFGVFFYSRLCREEGSDIPNRFGPPPKANVKQHGHLAPDSFPDVWNG